ncbi:MAG: cytochrome c-type biogenesis protein CcmH [Pseudomonadales bacterium]|nr:cytochrome c-type biogenesis protein CcmH [Pseudomonadales bacterium]
MKAGFRLFILFLSLWTSFSCVAEIEIHEFDDPQTKARFLRLSDELRCPKCQNTNLSGSNAPIAKDLRTQLIRLLKEGKTDQQIQQYMVDRYGDFVLYRPQFKKGTWPLWFGPLILLLLGLVVTGRIIRGRKAANSDAAEDMNMGDDSALSTVDQSRLDELMKSKNTDERMTGNKS